MLQYIYTYLISLFMYGSNEYFTISREIYRCKKLNIRPYENYKSINTIYPNITVAIKAMESITKGNIVKDLIRFPPTYPKEVKVYRWFTDNDEMLSDSEAEWLHLLTLYQTAVNIYFYNKSSNTPMVATNIVRMRGHIYEMYKLLQQF